MSTNTTARTATTSNFLLNRIFKSRLIILELLKEQGYDIGAYENFSANELEILINKNQLDMLVTNISTDRKVYVKYVPTVFKVASVNEIIEDLFQYNQTLTVNDTLYIIVKEDILNAGMKSAVMDAWKENYHVIIESLSRLQMNITKHRNVPKHVIMTDTEVSELLHKLQINDVQLLPKISRFDPVARCIFMRPNQVCHILRPSKSAIVADYYRLCI